MALIRSYGKRDIFHKCLRMSLNMNTPKSYGTLFEDLKSNPFFEKYATKIAALQEEQPDALKQRIEESEKQKQKKTEKAEVKERLFSEVKGHKKPQLDSNPFVKTKKLSDLMKLELLENKSDEEIKQLWLDYHRHRDAVASVIPKDIYSAIYERGKEFSTFILPLPRSRGYEFIVCQFVAHEVHFTPLIAFQTHKENAPECLTLIFYTDLQDKTGMVLMKGEFDTNILNCQEAQCLVNSLQLYYGQNNEKRLNLLKRFTYEPDNFNYMDLIAEIENLSL